MKNDDIFHFFIKNPIFFPYFSLIPKPLEVLTVRGVAPPRHNATPSAYPSRVSLRVSIRYCPFRRLARMASLPDGPSYPPADPRVSLRISTPLYPSRRLARVASLPDGPGYPSADPRISLRISVPQSFSSAGP